MPSLETKPWAVKAPWSAIGRGKLPGGFDGKEAQLDGELHVNRAGFGLIWNWLGMASMNNTIAVRAVFTHQ